jgi:hypothetical protein
VDAFVIQVLGWSAGEFQYEVAPLFAFQVEGNLVRPVGADINRPS